MASNAAALADILASISSPAGPLASRNRFSSKILCDSRKSSVGADPEILAEVPFFSLLDEQERAALAERVDTVSKPAGTALFNYGDPGDSLYIVRAGEVEIFFKNDTGERIVLETARQGRLLRRDLAARRRGAHGVRARHQGSAGGGRRPRGSGGVPARAARGGDGAADGGRPAAARIGEAAAADRLAQHQRGDRGQAHAR